MHCAQVTGDNRTTAEALAEELDLPKDRILAGVLPKDKVAKVRILLLVLFVLIAMRNCDPGRSISVGF